MKKKYAFLFSMMFLIFYWFFSPMFFDFGLGVTLPIFGWIGVEPFAFLTEYTIIIGGTLSLLLFYGLSRGEKNA
jgi:hypothetical protein